MREPREKRKGKAGPMGIVLPAIDCIYLNLPPRHKLAFQPNNVMGDRSISRRSRIELWRTWKV